VTLALDAFALEVALRPERERAAARGLSLRSYLIRSTDPASSTNVVGGGCAVVGGVVAIVGLALSEVTGSPAPDAVAGGLIGLLLLVSSVLLLQRNRELLSGRGVPPSMVREMSRIIARQDGGGPCPGSVRRRDRTTEPDRRGDMIFASDLDVPTVEETIVCSVAVLRQRWPSIEYVYLTPVNEARLRGAVRSSAHASDGRGPGRWQ